MDPLSYQPFLDQLIAFGSTEERKQDLISAKAEYVRLTTDFHDDDRSFDARMASFLDWYLYDRVAPATGRTPAQEFQERRQQEGAEADEVSALRGFTETVHGLFEVRKIGKGLVRLRDLYSGKDHDVTERRQVAGLEKGDVIEARLIPFGGHLLFSSAFIFHPKEGTKSVFKEIKRRKKKEPERDPLEIVWETSRMALKADRYRQIAIEKIYDFAQKKI
jgi:hypothetical protein